MIIIRHFTDLITKYWKVVVEVEVEVVLLLFVDLLRACVLLWLLLLLCRSSATCPATLHPRLEMWRSQFDQVIFA